MSGGGSTERALTRDDVSFDVSRVRTPPFPCPVPGDPPACPCKDEPPIFFRPDPPPAPGVCQLHGSTLDARRGVTFLVDSSSGPRARRRALPFWPPQLPLPAPRPPMPHHHTRPAAISAATPWRGTGNISTSRPHPARSTAISSIAGTHRETFSPEPTRTHPPSPIAQVQSVDPIQSIDPVARDDGDRRPSRPGPRRQRLHRLARRPGSHPRRSRRHRGQPRGAASGSAIPTRFTPQTLTTSTQLATGSKPSEGRRRVSEVQKRGGAHRVRSETNARVRGRGGRRDGHHARRERARGTSSSTQRLHAEGSASGAAGFEGADAAVRVRVVGFRVRGVRRTRARGCLSR